MSTPFVFLSPSGADTEAARKAPKEKPLPMNLIKRFAPIIAGVIALVIGFVAGHFIWP